MRKPFTRFGLAATIGFSAPALAQESPVTPNPDKWRPVVYRDLQITGPLDAPFTGVWADMIDRNNRRYAAVGDRRYAVGNAPAREAHFVVRGGDKVAMLSVLNIATACKTIAADPATNINVKMCPMRLVFWRGPSGGAKGSIHQAQGCYLEPGAQPGNFTPDPSYAVSYASYDVATKSIKLGVILAHKAVEKCSQTVPLHQE
jgi:hypothetical protein